jgi:hypothetical protein
MLNMIAPSGRVFVVYSDEEACILERLGWKRAET